MGRAKRTLPRRMGTKLRAIRLRLGFDQEEMAAELRAITRSKSIQPGHVSQYETGQREPLLKVLLTYARLGGVAVDVLIDDQVNLPLVGRKPKSEDE